jgi:hypothetical protein
MADKLLCLRALNAEVVAAGTVFTYRCKQCGHNVCMAPSSQKILALNPQIEIVCEQCFKPELRARKR